MTSCMDKHLSILTLCVCDYPIKQIIARDNKCSWHVFRKYLLIVTIHIGIDLYEVFYMYLSGLMKKRSRYQFRILCHSNYTSFSVQYQNALPSFNVVHDGNVSALLFCCDNRCNGTYMRYKFYCKKSTMLYVLYIYRLMLKHNSHIQADQYSR